MMRDTRFHHAPLLLFTALLALVGMNAAGAVCQNCYESDSNALCVNAELDDGYWGEEWTRTLTSVCDCGAKTLIDGEVTRYVCTGGLDCTDPLCDGGSTGGDPFNDDGGTSPIVVDLGRGGFELTGQDDPVQFDIDADGVVETISWTQAAGDDAFLVLDRDGDGSIGDGRELFGTAAPQPPSDEPNGFLALAVFDGLAEGGDGDGWITPADAVWASLRLWSDLDHDGVAQALELAPLDGFGIAGIELAYVDARRRDRHGNLLRWAARVRFAHGQRLAASDVIFLAP